MGRPSRLGARRWLFGLLVVCGCGTLGDGVPPPDEWPRTPLRGFVLRNLESPLLIEKAGFDLDAPTLEPDPSMPSLRVFGQLWPRNQPTKSQLFAVTLKNLDDQKSPDELFAATQPWEGQGLSNPVWLPGGLGVDFPSPLLFYQGSDGSVGVMWRQPAGDLVRLSQPLVVASHLTPGKLGRVSPVLLSGRLRLYFTVDDSSLRYAEADASSVALFLHRPSASVRFVSGPALLTAADFTVAVSRSQQVPAERLGAVFVRSVLTPAGRPRYDLYGRAEAMGKTALVAASSYRGDASEPFLPIADPLLAVTAGGVPGSPTVSESGGISILWLGLRTVASGIAVAVQQKDLPPKS